MFHMMIIVAGMAVCCAFSQNLTKVEILIDQNHIDSLEAHPYTNDDVPGTFIVDDTIRYDSVDLHYRGAYQLKTLIADTESTRRNWKVKVSKDKKYRNRLEWNYNYEKHLRQKLAFDLFSFAGVAVPSARHVVLYVNSIRQGLYLEFDDPDNKDWLKDSFGDKTGDLYKASYDMPDEPSYFGTLADLGDSSSNYHNYYTKKTNTDSTNALDYRSLVAFVKMINNSPQETFSDTIKKYFDVTSFVKYMVISNFIINWDSYPIRPKNYWLYKNFVTGVWSFIPWDVDATFQTRTRPMRLGLDLSVFYQVDTLELFAFQENEGADRPLARRMFKCVNIRNKYSNEYKAALNNYLNVTFMQKRIDSLALVLKNNCEADECDDVAKSVTAMKNFITQRYANVKKQLDTVQSAGVKQTASLRHVVPRSVLQRHSGRSLFIVTASRPQSIDVTDLAGKCLFAINTSGFVTRKNGAISIPLPNIAPGVYLFRSHYQEATVTEKLPAY